MKMSSKWRYFLQFFPPRCAADNIGEEYDGKKDPIVHLRHAIIDYVESVDIEGMSNPPDPWPEMKRFK